MSSKNQNVIGRRNHLLVFDQEPQRLSIVQIFGMVVAEFKQPGLKPVIPFISQVTQVRTDILQMGEPLNVKTQDEYFVDLPILVKFKVQDGKKYLFEALNPLDQILNDVNAAVRNVTAGKTFDDLYKDRSDIRDQVLAQLQQTTLEIYGVNILDIVIDEPVPSQEVRQSFNSARAAEQQRKEEITRAQGAREAAILRAQAESEARKLEGEGLAAYNAAVFGQYAQRMASLAKEGLKPAEAAEKMLQIIAVEAYREAAAHGRTILVSGSPAVSFAKGGATELDEATKQALLSALLEIHQTSEDKKAAASPAAF